MRKYRYEPPKFIELVPPFFPVVKKIAVADIPADLHPPVWFAPQWNWKYNEFLTPHLVQTFFESGPLKEKELKRLATYIRAYTAHVVIGAWLLLGGRAKTDYLIHYRPLLYKLKTIAQQEPFMHEYVQEMNALCVKMGIDPF